MPKDMKFVMGIVIGGFIFFILHIAEEIIKQNRSDWKAEPDVESKSNNRPLGMLINMQWGKIIILLFAGGIGFIIVGSYIFGTILIIFSLLFKFIYTAKRR